MTVLHCYFIYKLKPVLTANRKIIQKTLTTVVLNWLGKIFLILVFNHYHRVSIKGMVS